MLSPEPLTVNWPKGLRVWVRPSFNIAPRTYYDRDRRDPRNSAAAIKGARNECLRESADPWLRRCYDHLQNARKSGL